MKKIINNSWLKILENEFNKPYFKSLESFIDSEYKCKTIYPKEKDIFNAFNMCSIENTKVVILGQDPYHNPNEAMGLAFSVNDGIKIPPSLKNIYKELKDDLGVDIPKSGNLSRLEDEGVLLLNTTLTVEENKPLSHFNKGWEIFTDNVIEYLGSLDRPICFVLWGNNSRLKRKLIKNKNALIIESAHPSPLSAYHGFFNSKPFSKINNYLRKNNIKEINWNILNEA